MVAQEVFNQLILNQRGLMSEQKAKEFILQKGYKGIASHTVICKWMDEYAKSYALQVAREAVEECLAYYKAEKYTTGSHADSLAYVARVAICRVLTRIESKL